LGGPGVEFVVRECRIWQLSALGNRATADQAGTNASAAQDRSFVEIYAIPQKGVSGEAGTKFSASHWDRFTASLFMVLRLDAGQANYFELAEAASREHPSYVLAADAALRASRKPKPSEATAAVAAANAGVDKPALKEASLDAINLQLQRIEDLRRKLEREESMILELAPAVEATAVESSAAPIAAPAVVKTKKRFALVSALTAAAAAVVAGIWWLVRGF
jgi:hypothetical protein